MPFHGVNPGPLSRADARELNELLLRLQALLHLNLCAPLVGGIDLGGIHLGADMSTIAGPVEFTEAVTMDSTITQNFLTTATNTTTTTYTLNVSSTGTTAAGFGQT